MRENRFNTFLRPILFMLPLMLGSPFISFCMCAFNSAMTIIGSGPVAGGIITAVTALIGAVMCAMMGLGESYALAFAMELVLASVVCALCVLRRKSFRTGVLLSSVAYGAPMLYNLKVQADNAGLSIADNLLAGLFDPMREVLSQTAARYGIDPEQVLEMFELMKKGVGYCLPAVMVVSAWMAGYVLMWMVSRALRSTPLDNGHSFAQIRLPLAALAYGAAMIILMFVPLDWARIIAVNGLLVLMVMAFAAGMSLLEYIMRLKIKSSMTRIFIHCAILGFSMFLSPIMPLFNIFSVALIYILAAVTDAFVSIRKRVSATNEK